MTDQIEDLIKRDKQPRKCLNRGGWAIKWKNPI